MRDAALSSHEIQYEEWPSSLGNIMVWTERRARESDSISEKAHHYNEAIRAVGSAMKYDSGPEHDERRGHVLSRIMAQEADQQRNQNREALTFHSRNLDAQSHPLYQAMNRLDNAQYIQQALEVFHTESDNHRRGYRLGKVLESQHHLNESLRALARICEDEKSEILAYARERPDLAQEVEDDVALDRDRIHEIERDETTTTPTGRPTTWRRQYWAKPPSCTKLTWNTGEPPTATSAWSRPGRWITWPGTGESGGSANIPTKTSFTGNGKPRNGC